MQNLETSQQNVWSAENNFSSDVYEAERILRISSIAYARSVLPVLMSMSRTSFFVFICCGYVARDDETLVKPADPNTVFKILSDVVSILLSSFKRLKV